MSVALSMGFFGGVLLEAQVPDAQEAFVQRTLWYALVPVVTAFAFLIFVFYRYRREAYFREKESALRLELSGLELKALRTQMNPHFIFNCLNSIHHYMHRNDTQAAGEYLIKFSRLIRHVLETSFDRFIPLTEELESLRWYLELEQMRLHHTFSFQIEVSPDCRPDEVRVPPLMVQPFVENSIWHGLSNRKDGRIRIQVRQLEGLVEVVIDDNGALEMPATEGLVRDVKKKSHGLELVRARLEAANKLYGSSASFRLEDVVTDGQPAGKRVVLFLPYED